MKRIHWLVFAIFAFAVSAFASDVTLELNATASNQGLVVSVKTNLPANTVLMATVVSPVDQGGDGYTGQVQAVVSADHLIRFGPFTQGGNRLSPGVYQATVSTVMAALQPKDVQPFFGQHGEGLTGQYVSTLPGTSERVISHTFRVQINQDGSIGAPESSEPGAARTIGSADDKWQKVESGGKEIYVKTNGFYYTKPGYSGYGFHTYIVANLPESSIVGAPKSVMNDVEGNCETRTFHVLGTLFFTGKNRSGVAMKNLPAENVERKVIPGSAFEKAFDMLCATAEGQK